MVLVAFAGQAQTDSRHHHLSKAIGASVIATTGIVVATLDSLGSAEESEGNGASNSQKSSPFEILSIHLRKITLERGKAFVKETFGSRFKIKRLLRPFGRKAAVVADIAASVAEAVPMLGPTVKGALEAAMKVQRMLEKRRQNMEAIGPLILKLQWLDQQLSSGSRSTFNASLIKHLGEIENTLRKLAEEDGMDFEYGASVINQCEKDLCFVMDQASIAGHAETRALVKAEIEGLKRDLGEAQKARLEYLQTIAALEAVRSGPTLISFSIWIVDPFGALANDLLFRYADDKKRRPALKRYLGHKRFELSQDLGHRLALLDEKDLVTLERDSTLIVSVVAIRRTTVKGVKCPWCAHFIPIALTSQRGHCQCLSCSKIVQVGQENGQIEQDIEGSNEDGIDEMSQIVIKTVRPTPVCCLEHEVDRTRLTSAHTRLYHKQYSVSQADALYTDDDTSPPSEHLEALLRLNHSRKPILEIEPPLTTTEAEQPETVDEIDLPVETTQTTPNMGHFDTIEEIELPTSMAQIGSFLECPDISRRIRLPVLESHQFAGEGLSNVFLGSYKPHGRNKVKVAIKIIRVGGRLDNPRSIAKLQRRIARESRLWYSFRHENIIPLYGLVRDPSLSTTVPGLVSPFCEKGTVLQYVQMAPRMKRVPLIKGVANGLKYLHGIEVVHGDLRSANVLMSDDLRPLITGFGCSKTLGVVGNTTGMRFSSKYLAPELIDLAEDEWVGTEAPTTKETDVWAFGLVCAEIVGGQEVFLRIRPSRLPQFIIAQHGIPRKEDFPNRSKEADVVWPLLKTCWEYKAHQRPTMGAVVASLA
ncbi:hypothetical protein NMY22_g3049 [Coprinellus aureogranulatus]|nr:hypothetical protein NMY22_g3049 [Coprinellus aureogranulatus]